jgi:ferritin-like metal-binding protein YciE
VRAPARRRARLTEGLEARGAGAAPHAEVGVSVPHDRVAGTQSARQARGVTVLERFDNPKELFTYKLGAALTMEQKVLNMLHDLEDDARSDQLKQQIHRHAQETEQQIGNVRQAFSEVGEEPDDKPCPAIDGIRLEGRANIARTDDRLKDVTVLSAIDETEHHEIAVYETLIAQAEAMNQPAAASLLRQNLEQEQRTLDAARQATQQVAQQTAAAAG